MPAAVPPPPVRSLADRLTALRAQVPGRIVFTTSFGLEDQALTHAVVECGVDVEFATLDTGRLFAETYQLWAETEARYGIAIRAAWPDGAALGGLMRRDGPMGFRQSKAARLDCCGVRKVEPLSRLLAGAGGWLTGLRGARGGDAEAPLLAWDEQYGLWKAAPLADWSREEVADYCRAHGVPTNPLHAAGYLSIGCQPCTRPVAPGEDERAGRWWWETGEARECGLHLGPDGRLVRSAGVAA